MIITYSDLYTVFQLTNDQVEVIWGSVCHAVITFSEVPAVLTAAIKVIENCIMQKGKLVIIFILGIAVLVQIKLI